jgi:predicted nucleic acid-binding protein
VYTLDTNAIIYAVKGDEKAIPILREILADGSVSIYVATITETELFSYQQLEIDEAILIENFLRKISRVSLDSQIARGAAVIRRRYELKLADSVIAATAGFMNSTLVTRNIEDFKKVLGLRLLEI